jgi:hypothetical protein
MQIQWLQRTLSYWNNWNKLVANKAESELLDFVLAAEVWQGLHEDHDHDCWVCWAKELVVGRAEVCGPQHRLEDPHAAV